MRFLKTVTALSIIVLLLFMTYEQVSASTNVGVVQSDAPLNVRDLPSEEGSIIGKLEPGNKIEYFHTSTDWVKITYAGQVGYVSKAFISGTASTGTTSTTGHVETKTGVIASTGGLNVRSGPQQSESVLGQLANGTQIDYIDLGNDWAQITYNGAIGFIHTHYIQSMVMSPTVTPIVNEPTAKQGFKVVLDAGHGGYDSGAVANGLLEKHVVRAYKDELKRTLAADGIDVIETRTGDEFVSLSSRVNQANQAQADLFLSIHANSFADSSVRGFETHYYQSSKEAVAINKEISRLNSGYTRGIYQSNFQVLRDSNVPAVLIEVGYLTNADDAYRMQTNQHQQEVSEAVRRAVQQLK
ncbi:N-acetylmuramoyl-L-alanine amidase [Shouchella miscanthi]|uniref:N-acetylmuramoyl-L-alanine amidase n=1 Tax=Shouchella miscanthi TaxID=2598861 RepID=UPI0011A64EFA|nr:N-acetylmuramoyl-L-alanine amidase [Shouchella miscanthi]